MEILRSRYETLEDDSNNDLHLSQSDTHRISNQIPKKVYGVK